MKNHGQVRRFVLHTEHCSRHTLTRTYRTIFSLPSLYVRWKHLSHKILSDGQHHFTGSVKDVYWKNGYPQQYRGVATVSTSVKVVDRRENQYLTDTEMFDGCEIINLNNNKTFSTSRILGTTESGLKNAQGIASVFVRECVCPIYSTYSTDTILRWYTYVFNR